MITEQVLVVGMTTVDMLYELDSHPQEDSENYAHYQDVVIGGPAGRSAIAIQRLGGEVKQLSTIGNDHFAQTLRNLSAAEGVQVDWYEADQPSQNSAILLARDTGTRTTIWRPQPPATELFLAQISSEVRRSRITLVDCTDAAVLATVRDASSESSIETVCDTGSFKEWAEPLLRGISHIVAPQKFLAPFLTQHLPDQVDAPLSSKLECARLFFDSKTFAVTCGDQGGYVSSIDSGVFRYQALAVDTVDSCGAGDSFHGGLTWALSQGLNVCEAYATAAWVAAKKCSGLGNASLPRHDEYIADLDTIKSLNARCESLN